MLYYMLNIITRQVWTKPVANNLRSGFEVTGYMGNVSKQLSTWSKPVANNLRSGFEVTGYMGHM